MKSTLARERDKIKANLEGIRKMDRMPGVMFIVDTRREHIAVKEARKLGVKTMALIDTDSDPDLIDLPIPGNDDAMRAIEMILKELGRRGDRRQDGSRRDQGRGAAATPPPQQPHRLPGRGPAGRRGTRHRPNPRLRLLKLFPKLNRRKKKLPQMKSRCTQIVNALAFSSACI